MAAFSTIETRTAPIAINHQGQFPVVTLSFNLAPNASLGEAVDAVNKAKDEVGLPASIQAAFQGTAEAFQASLANEPVLILAALVTVYIVLGVLYESYIHPITILSTLPSAGVGALLALFITGSDFSVIALIGIVLLIGIVKKNAIMMIDFALEAERHEGKSPRGRHFSSLPAALPSHHDDHHGGAVGRRSAGAGNGRRLGAAAAARHHHRGRLDLQPDADALYHARDLSVLRPPGDPILAPASRDARAAPRRGSRTKSRAIAMNISEPFIRRPIATTLLTAAMALAGAVAFRLLPVSPLPQVDFPTISVSASLPGASPETMASSVATPLERQFGHIASVTEMTSSSTLGATSITLQFDLNRNIDAAARDVQAAINAARGYLPTNLPSNPSYRKVNPADAPIFMLALTSDQLSKGQMYDAASTIMAQKLSQVTGVGQVVVGGSALPGVRVELNPTQLNKYGIGLEQVRSFLAGANANTPKGDFQDGKRRWEVGANDQIFQAIDYSPLVIAYRNGSAVHISDVGEAVDSVEDLRNAGYANGKPSVLVIVFRQPGANIIDTVDQIRAVLPQLAGLHSARHRPAGGHGSDRHHPRLGARCGDHAADFDRAGDPGGVRFPEKPSDHLHPQHRRSRFADGHLRRDVSGGLQHRQSFVDGADHFHRICRGRRHRGHRKHHALSGAGNAAVPGRAQGRAGDRVHGAHHQLVADRGLHSAADDGRHRGTAVARVRRHAVRRDSGFDGGFAHHHAHDVRAPAARGDRARLVLPQKRAVLHLGGEHSTAGLFPSCCAIRL